MDHTNTTQHPLSTTRTAIHQQLAHIDAKTAQNSKLARQQQQHQQHTPPPSISNPVCPPTAGPIPTTIEKKQPDYLRPTQASLAKKRARLKAADNNNNTVVGKGSETNLSNQREQRGESVEVGSWPPRNKSGRPMGPWRDV